MSLIFPITYQTRIDACRLFKIFCIFIVVTNRKVYKVKNMLIFMNLRDKISFNAKQEDLEVLLAEPFEIDVDDIPIIYVVGWNYYNEKSDLVGKSGFTERKKDGANLTVGYDYSSEKRIVLAYLYSHLKEAGISEDILKDVRTIYDGIMFNHGESGWYKDAFLFRGPELVSQVYPEYVEKIEQFESKYKPVLERIKQSGEHDKLVKILNKYIGYDQNLGSGKITGIKDKVTMLRGGERDKYLNQIARALSTNNKNTVLSVHLRGAHNLPTAYGAVSKLIKGRGNY